MQVSIGNPSYGVSIGPSGVSTYNPWTGIIFLIVFVAILLLIAFIAFFNWLSGGNKVTASSTSTPTPEPTSSQTIASTVAPTSTTNTSSSGAALTPTTSTVKATESTIKTNLP